MNHRIIPLKNESPSICSACGGQCCQWKPGIYHPDQLFKGVSTSELKAKIHELLDSGDYVVTWTTHISEGSKLISSIQPRTAYYDGKLAIDSDGMGKCIHLTPTGCSHLFEQRPLECQSLVPRQSLEEQTCHHPENSKILIELGQAWGRYSGLFDTIEEERWDKYSKKLGDARYAL